MYTYGITGSSINEFQDVTITGVLDDQILQYNTATGQWENVTASLGGGIAGALNDLSDVVLTSPAEFQVLEYDGTNWINKYAPVVTEVRNVDTVTLTTGTAVYLFGATGDIATVKRADNNSDATSSKVVGLVGNSIAQNESGPVVTRGYVDGINLSVGYAPGDILYLGEDGGFTKVKPVAPKHTVFLGVVCRANANGIVYVATQNGYELEELHNVKINGSLADNDVLQYDGATSLWKNTALSALGITLGTDTTGNYVSDVTSGTGITVTHTPGEGSSASVALNATLDNLSNVTAPAPSTGDFLKWNGSAWVNDDIDLGTDTTGNYVSDVTSGTGITVTHTPSEGSSASVALNAALDNLSDVVVSSAAIGQVLEHNGTNFVNRMNRAPQYGLQTAVTTRKYTIVNGFVPAVAGINVGSAATIVFKNACSVTDLSIYLNATYTSATTYDYRLGIYADSSGAPGALIVDAGTVSIAQNATAGFKTINLASAVSVAANTPIWLVCAATHTGAVPTLINYAGNYQPYSDYGLSSATHFQAACLGYTTGPATALPATFSLASPETQPIGVAVWATVSVP